MTINITILWKIFSLCHEGKINKLFHILGFTLIFLGILHKSIYLLLLGGIVQELGHVYQYHKTGYKKHHPLTCIKPQSFFAYPIFFLMIIYVLFF